MKGDPKSTALVLAKEPEIAWEIERANVKRVTLDMTLEEAAEAYSQAVSGGRDED
jgi:hypothetical protein